MRRCKSAPFHVVLVGGDELVSAAVQAMAVAHTRGLSPGVLTFSIVPTGKKEMNECVKEDVVSVLSREQLFPSSEGTDELVCCSSWPCLCSCVHPG